MMRNEYQEMRLQIFKFTEFKKRPIGFGIACLSMFCNVADAANELAIPPAAVASQSSRAGDLLRSGAVEQKAADQQREAKGIMDSVNDQIVEKTKELIPKLNQLGSGIKYGTHAIVSEHGEEVIWLIHDVATAKPEVQHADLRKLVDFSNDRVPEAMNFMGFMAEHGLLGARKDLRNARRYYEAAAHSQYQPAILNLALMAAYGKGESVDRVKALGLFQNAYAIGGDVSGRVCSLAAFFAYRANLPSLALKYSTGCNTPLGQIPQAAFNDAIPMKKRYQIARDSLSTGINDGYGIIAQLSGNDLDTDTTYTFCKYRLLQDFAQYRATLQDASKRCLIEVKHLSYDKPLTQEQTMAVKGIAGFVFSENENLTKSRQSNHFHYGWGVPFLPFAQTEVNLFEPLIEKVNP